MTATPLNPNGAILNTATPLKPKRSELLQLRTRRMVSTRPYSLSTVRHMAAMIGRNKKRRIEGMRDLECGTRPRCAFRAAISGKTFAPGLEEPPMFKMPAYDPVGIAILGFGVLAVVALAFAF